MQSHIYAKIPHRGLTIENSYRAMSNVSISTTTTTTNSSLLHVKRSQAVGFCPWAGRGEWRDFIWEMFVAGNKDKDRRTEAGGGRDGGGWRHVVDDEVRGVLWRCDTQIYHTSTITPCPNTGSDSTLIIGSELLEIWQAGGSRSWSRF